MIINLLLHLLAFILVILKEVNYLTYKELGRKIDGKAKGEKGGEDKYPKFSLLLLGESINLP